MSKIATTTRTRRIKTKTNTKRIPPGEVAKALGAKPRPPFYKLKCSNGCGFKIGYFFYNQLHFNLLSDCNRCGAGYLVV